MFSLNLKKPRLQSVLWHFGLLLYLVKHVQKRAKMHQNTEFLSQNNHFFLGRGTALSPYSTPVREGDTPSLNPSQIDAFGVVRTPPPPHPEVWLRACRCRCLLWYACHGCHSSINNSNIVVGVVVVVQWSRMLKRCTGRRRTRQ